MERSELLRMHAQLADQMNDDELAVSARIMTRIVLGKPTYGSMGIDRDPRDFAVEWQEELLDACAYGAILIEQRVRKGRP